MISISRATLISVSLAVVIAAFPPSSRADIGEDIRGVLTDPFKFGKGGTEISGAVHELRGSAERIMNQLTALEGTGAAHLQVFLEQVRDILKDANADVQNALTRMQALETQVDIDANRLLYKVQCLGPNLNASLQGALSQLIDNIIKANPKVELLGLSGDLKVTPIKIDNPDVAYRILKKETFDLLKDKKAGGTLSPDSDPSQIFWAYQDLILVARGFQCRYLDQQGELPFIQEVNRLELSSWPWIKVVHMDPLSVGK